MLNRTARRFLGLTGTLLSDYADDLFNTLFRTDAKRMTEDGYECGSAGRERFTRDFGVIETIERITVEDNACSKKTKKTVTIKRKPGASPLLFGKYLMDHCAFIGLESGSIRQNDPVLTPDRVFEHATLGKPDTEPAQVSLATLAEATAIYEDF